LGLSFGELRQAGREAAQLGFESLWTPAGGVPDAFHVCAAWSADGPLRTGISVVPAARMWGPLALAAQAATVGQLSDGRFVLGIGTGGYGPAFWASLGLPDRPIAIMRDYLVTLRALLAGETVTYEGPGLRIRGATLGTTGLSAVPLQLGALGPQMVRLAGELADGALLNWATPQRIADSRRLVAEGAARAGRDPQQVALTMYIRVCVDEDVAAARRALGAQVLGYALGRPGTPSTAGYRGLFGQMGFDDTLSDLEARRSKGATMDDMVDAAPDELLTSVGYFGPASGAPEAYARLTPGLDESVVRIVTARRGLEPVVTAMAALTPDRIRAAVASAEARP
jgi:alkanesulfonate monooxygenase SsuD/methylene tetrahydromethanopterin reductase-like flavin-dependent oxidoreductase (luciferase family)